MRRRHVVWVVQIIGFVCEINPILGRDYTSALGLGLVWELVFRISCLKFVLDASMLWCVR
jgi:hypothetical protein